MKDKNSENILDFLKLVGVGLVAGFINGFFGAGGGLLLVPLISYVGNKNSKVAHATTLGCVLVMCLASSVFYFVKKHWPSFKAEDVDDCVVEYQKRHRRFGK